MNLRFPLAADRYDGILSEERGHYRIFRRKLQGGAENKQPRRGLSPPLTHLGNLAIRTGKPIDFDPGAMKVTNGNEVADKLLHGVYENGWKMEA